MKAASACMKIDAPNGETMPINKQATARGRPRSITREKIADAGIEIGLPNITVVGMAAALGVSHMALYKHVASLDALKHLVAEEIFQRWELPQAVSPGQISLQEYLTEFTHSVRTFVKAHPGVTPYVIRRMAATPAMLEKIDAHQTHIAQAYGISKEQSRWLLATVTFFCIAAADTVYSAARLEPVIAADLAQEEGEMEAEFMQGTQALIVGALTLLHPTRQDAAHLSE